MKWLTLNILLFIQFIYMVSSTDPVVSTSLGDIVGKTITLSLDIIPNKDVHQYLGIPYAQAPTGERRFRKPEAPPNFTSSYFAKNHGAMCPQVIQFAPPSLDMSEDCLFLNVYVPDQTPDHSSGHAVMVWIHGGGFLEGAGSLYDGSFIATYGNVIVVTINYRLGLFGFLSTGDYNVPGNAGLWDQQMALQWVHSHIGSFGGDNNRVTVVGGSAGAISTMLQGFMPKNGGLFQRIITQSGSILNPRWEKNVLSEAKIAANDLGCISVDTPEMVQCLREKSVEEVLAGMKRVGFLVNFGPTIDMDFIKINPKGISRMPESKIQDEVSFFRSLDILSGFNAYEGVFFLPFTLRIQQPENFNPSRDEMSNSLVPSVLNNLYRDQDFQNEITKLVEAQYTTWTNPSDSSAIRLQIVKMIGDGTFGVPAIEMARLHKKSTSSRNFMFHFTPKISYQRMPMPSWLPGATHSDEVPFVFGKTEDIGVGEQNGWELVLVTQMATYWTNFIKSGDPNSPMPVTAYWPEYNLETGDYLKLEKSMSNTSAGQYFYAEEANFWLHVFPDLVDAVNKVPENCGDNHGLTSNADILSSAMQTHFIAIIIVFSYMSPFALTYFVKC